jgi:hypothetical protein
MPNFQYVGQEVGSNDCGFFSGYVLKLFKEFRNFSNMSMTREEVYAARNGFKSSSHSGAGTEWLVPSEATRYLGALGMRGSVETLPNVRDGASILGVLLQVLSTEDCCGVMVAEVGQLFHWVAIFGGNEQAMVVYDPGPKEDGVHARVVDSATLSKALAYNGVGGLIRAS